jgi:hypothetical protein
MTGKFPEICVDHINGVRDDNRWINLRSVSHSENCQNQKKAQLHNKTSGLLGVCWNKKQRKWVSFIRVNKHRMYIGCFDCKYEAHQAYLEKKRELHSTCTI